MSQILLFFLFFISLLNTEPLISIPQPISLVIQQKQDSIIEPFPILKSVSSLKIYQTNYNNTPSSQTDSSVCRVVEAELKTSLKHLQTFQESNTVFNPSKPLYHFDQLLHLKNVIDMIYFKKQYYVLFEDGNVHAYTLKENGFSLEFKIQHKQIFEQGYLATSLTRLIYVTQNAAYLIDTENRKVQKLQGYTSNTNFEYARFYGNTLFVALDVDGFVVYTFNEQNNTLSNKKSFDLRNTTANKDSAASPPEISDLDYDPATNTLFLLDRSYGVRFFTFKNNEIQALPNQTLKEKDCENIIYNNSLLYLTCPELIVYNMTSREIFKRTQSRISPQDIQLFQDKIVLVSDSHVAIFENYQNQPIYTSVFEPTRLIIQENRNSFVYINDYEIIEEKFNMTKELVRCGDPYWKEPGNYTVRVEGKAPCNLSYISKLGIQGNYKQNELCTYSVKLNVNIWEPKQIQWIPILIIGGGLLWSLCVLIIWCCVRNVQLQNQYQSLVNQIQTTEAAQEKARSEESRKDHKQ